MERFIASCDAADGYPLNLVHHHTYEHNLRAYAERLDEREKSLFSTESEASLDFWDFDDGELEFRGNCIRSGDELKKKLHIGVSSRRYDPRSRFIFVHAPSSREQLRTTRSMLTLSLTYHQVMPAYLDFLFPFGRQLYAKDFHFSGFRHENSLGDPGRAFNIPELGRSGQELRLCYSLKSVEPSGGHRDSPWTIRQTSIYHAFDMITGRATWVLIKGNELMRDRVESATGSHGLSELTSFATMDRAFATSLATHLIFCDWSGENWRWYINFLEESLQEKTRRTLVARVDTLSSPISEKLTSRGTGLTAGVNSSLSPIPEKLIPRGTDITTRSMTRPPPSAPIDPTNPPPKPDRRQDFSFSQLQRVQFIEEKANEALLVLKANISVLSELDQCYRSVINSGDSPEEIASNCETDMTRFESRIASVINDLRMQQSRAETLLRLLADRKSLLYGILQYQSMEASNLLAQRAQQSADHMEGMTRDMHQLARKTKQETVSMRIITLVTLFFLPGTFISLHQTLMSTDIIHFQTGSTGKSEKTFQLGALQLFLAISFPLMFLTFAAWYGVYWWVNRKDKLKAIKVALLSSEA
jgi:hypothetical protein